MTNHSLPQISELLLPGRGADGRGQKATESETGSTPDGRRFEEYLRSAGSRSSTREPLSRHDDRWTGAERAHQSASRTRPTRQTGPTADEARRQAPDRIATDRSDRSNDRAGMRTDDRVSSGSTSRKTGTASNRTVDGDSVGNKPGKDVDAEDKTADLDPSTTDTVDARDGSSTAESDGQPQDARELTQSDLAIEAADSLTVSDQQLVDPTEAPGLTDGADASSPDAATEGHRPTGGTIPHADAEVDDGETTSTDGDPAADPAASADGADPAAATAGRADETQQVIADELAATGATQAAPANESDVASNQQNQVDGDEPAGVPGSTGEPGTDGEPARVEGGGRAATDGATESSGEADVDGEASAQSDSDQDDSDSDSGAADGEAESQPTDADGDPTAQNLAVPQGRSGNAAASTTGAAAIGGVGEATAVSDATTVNGAGGPAPADQADGSEPLWRQVRRALGSLRNLPTGEQQLTIRLRPDDLGSVVVRIRTGEAGTTVALVAESAAAANQLNQQRQLLVDELQQGGLRGVAVDIGTGADTDQTPGDGEADVEQGDGGLGGSRSASATADGQPARTFRGGVGRGTTEGLVDVDL